MLDKTVKEMEQLRAKYETYQIREKKYLRIVSRKLQIFLEDYNKDVLEFSYLSRVDYEDICRIYFGSAGPSFNLLCHVSSCIDAIRHNRYYFHDWELINCVDYNKEDNAKRFDICSHGYEFP